MKLIRVLSAFFSLMALADVKDPTLYVVGYTHLDTEWTWSYPKTIDPYLHDTLVKNFDRFDHYPFYTFNFTGSRRYGYFKEYYPELYDRLKGYVANDRWFVAGSSVDEFDTLEPSPESMFRQILYGNEYFRKEFGKTSEDLLLPDSFGFTEALPSVIAHAGLKGFSTQKLYWNSAVGIPFNVGLWQGPDGATTVAALNPSRYNRAWVPFNSSKNSTWIDRIQENGKKTGVYADYRYFGIGDHGGAPDWIDLWKWEQALKHPGPLKLVLGRSDQLFRDLSEKEKTGFSVYQGDLLLTEHSAGSLTSTASIKFFNRKGEVLAQNAEGAAVLAEQVTGQPYPKSKIDRGWLKLLGNQTHDIMAGTGNPDAYRYAFSDAVVSQNDFADVLNQSVSALSSALKQNSKERNIVIWNSLSVPRAEVTEVRLKQNPEKMLQNVQVLTQEGEPVETQLIEASDQEIHFLFLAEVPSLGARTYSVVGAEPEIVHPNLESSTRFLENEFFHVDVDSSGDVSQIFDLKNDRQVLKSPARLQFLSETPKKFPSWNMDWADREREAYAELKGTAQFRWIERGPLRSTLEVRRRGEGSEFLQRIRISKNSPIVEWDTEVLWNTRKTSLKAAFPLTFSNPVAHYNMGLGVIDRSTNNSKKYEVPAQQWFELSEPDGSYGVSVLEDSKYGSDKPDDSTLRLTLLYTPGGAGLLDFGYQRTQDFGRHHFRYALYPHRGDYRSANTEWSALAFNSPLLGFEISSPVKNNLPTDRLSLLQVSTKQVAVRAVKKAERNPSSIVLRLQELFGQKADQVEISGWANIQQVFETDGQEHRLREIRPKNGKWFFSFEPFSPKTLEFLLSKPASSMAVLNHDTDISVPLPFNEDVTQSRYPGNLLPREVDSQGVRFENGKRNLPNAVAARGQKIELEAFGKKFMSLLFSADVDLNVAIKTNLGRVIQIYSPAWNQDIAQPDSRKTSYFGLFTKKFPSFFKKANIADYVSHTLREDGGPDIYRLGYFYSETVELIPGETTLEMPNEPRFHIFGITLSSTPSRLTNPTQDLIEVPGFKSALKFE